MTRLAFLAGALLLFMGMPSIMLAVPSVPPRWKVRLSAVALFGLVITAASLLAAVLMPEALYVSSARQLWQSCSRAFAAIHADPLARVPAIIGASGLAVLSSRFIWGLILSAKETRAALVRGSEPNWRLQRGDPVYVLPLEHPEAYSVGLLRKQIVVSQGLLEILDPEETEAVLLHEEAHLHSGHHWLLMLAGAAQTALNPLPGARHALTVLEQGLEEAADQYAASQLGSSPTVASGLSKAALAGLRSPVGVVALGTDLDIPARIRRLLAPPSVSPWVPFVCGLTLLVLLSLLALTQLIAGLAVVAAAHHFLGLGAAAMCPLVRPTSGGAPHSP